MSLSHMLTLCQRSAAVSSRGLLLRPGSVNIRLAAAATLQQQQQQHGPAAAAGTPINQQHNRTFLTMACVQQQQRCVSIDNINPAIKTMEYAVRGPLVIRAGVIEKELEQGVKKPFKEVIRANIGDCHAMGQPPITFIRQVLGLVSYPPLFNDPTIPADAKKRARDILDGCKGGSVGSYSDSAGIEVIRRHAAEYIQRRDGGIPADWQNIILSAGASGGIKVLMALLRCPIDGKKPGVMIPIPQYPLYSATIAEFDMEQIGYYLDEANKWGLDIAELERSLKEARKTSAPRILVVINPGNPTGQVLSRSNIEEIIKFAQRERLVLFADEVYQDNVYEAGSKFHSFKKVMMEMGEPYSKMELCSFMSCSKGYMGECGIRGGYAEIVNLCPDVRTMLLKCISAQLCPTTAGQAVLDCVVNPPQKGEPSYEQFEKEKKAVLESLRERAELVARTFNSIEGFSCNPVQGAMYAFPQIRLPPKALEAAKKEGKPADTFYAFQLLEETGICIVPGSGFGQRPDTYHFRTTILPQPEKLKEMLGLFKSFHEKFLQKYK
uniref:alanine transaminase n=1 Tax=Anopheles epiroticus TaxID=199890 RepID=A0A182PL20_9DIPT